MDDPISSEQLYRYRGYDIHTQVIGLIPPFLSAFSVVHSSYPHGERISRECNEDYRTLEAAHAGAFRAGKRLVDLLLGDLESRAG